MVARRDVRGARAAVSVFVVSDLAAAGEDGEISGRSFDNREACEV